MVDCGGLENRWACKRPVGSNPTLSAILSYDISYLECFECVSRLASRDWKAYSCKHYANRRRRWLLVCSYFAPAEPKSDSIFSAAPVSIPGIKWA